MDFKREYNIIIGSKTFFENVLSKSDLRNSKYFLELIQISDYRKKNNIDCDIRVNCLVLENNNYHGIVEAAHDRLPSIIEELTTDNASIYLHNPPRILREYLQDLDKREIIILKEQKQKYEMLKDSKKFEMNINAVKDNIIGQDSAIREVSKSLWYLTKVDRKKPYVIMFYGKSSLGKTELVREISKKFFNYKYLEKHLSMFKNSVYSDYFFGESPNRRSFAYDLLERESNLLFFDEMDKCPEYFFSAFYTLFDNTIFKDATYDVDISGLVIILTSNYQNEREIMEHLGLPIYYRIDKFVHFKEFDVSTIYSIVLKELEDRKEEYSDILSLDDVYAAVSPKILTEKENARTIKQKVQHVIEDLLFSNHLDDDK